MLLRCTCCHRWTVRTVELDGRQVLRIRFNEDVQMKDCRTPLEVKDYLDPVVYASLEPEPEDDGCE